MDYEQKERSQNGLDRIYLPCIFEPQRIPFVLNSFALNVPCRTHRLVKSDLRRLSASAAVPLAMESEMPAERHTGKLRQLLRKSTYVELSVVIPAGNFRIPFDSASFFGSGKDRGILLQGVDGTYGPCGWLRLCTVGQVRGTNASTLNGLAHRRS